MEGGREGETGGGRIKDRNEGWCFLFTVTMQEHNRAHSHGHTYSILCMMIHISHTCTHMHRYFV